MRNSALTSIYAFRYKYLTHGEDIVQLDFVDDKYGWAIARDGRNLTQLLKTSDGGRTWNALEARIQSGEKM